MCSISTPDAPKRKAVTPDELKTCLRVLRMVANVDVGEGDPEIEEVRQQLVSIAKAAHKRNRRKERAESGEAARRAPQTAAPAAPPAEATVEGVVPVPPAFLAAPP